MLGFVFSSRRRHTRCALVTGVQTCALPICEPQTCGEQKHLWEQSVFAIQATRLFRPTALPFIASKLCSYRLCLTSFAPTGLAPTSVVLTQRLNPSTPTHPPPDRPGAPPPPIRHATSAATAGCSPNRRFSVLPPRSEERRVGK